MREWHGRPDQVSAVNLVLTEDAESDEDEGELPLWEELHQDIGDCQIGDQLADMQKRELKDLLYEYNDRFSYTFGCTDLVEHRIKVNSETPITCKLYPVPDSLKQ